jgi:hypothetical protein
MRDCDGCTLCCKLMPIESENKPAFEWCKFCNPKEGCTIYDTRYEKCKVFQCLWTWAEETLGELIKELKPNKVKFILLHNRKTNTIEIVSDPAFPDAWKKYIQILEYIGDQIAVVAFTKDLPIGIGKIAIDRFSNPPTSTRYSFSNGSKITTS